MVGLSIVVCFYQQTVNISDMFCILSFIMTNIVIGIDARYKPFKLFQLSEIREQH